MPLINIDSLSKLDIAILKATGCELVPVNTDENLVLSLDGRTYYAIPIHE